MATFTEVPILEVNSENFRQIWPTLEAAIKSSTFVAIDAELSGLGEKKLLFARDIDARYGGMREAAQTRSIISLGLSCFQLQPTKQPVLPSTQPVGKSLPFLVQTFNILVLCSENYTVEPASLKFLIEHGFDFNKQYEKGLPYYRGCDKTSDKEQQSLRQLFTFLISCGTPVILHNAPVDLVFLYHSFYNTLPSHLNTFLADLSEILTGGVFDTKYIAEYKARYSASYLEYVFRRCQRQNNLDHQNGQSHVRMIFPPYPKEVPHIKWLPCGLYDKPAEAQQGKEVPCRDFAAHGWCGKKNDCPFSHDIDTILNKEDIIRSKKRKRKAKKQCEANGMDVDKDDVIESVDQSDEESDNSITKDNPKPVSKTEGHRAGYDAFMTGFAFAFFVAKYGHYGDIEAGEKLFNLGLEEYYNKVALSGKDIPLQIAKSAFAKTSKEHREKIQAIRTPNKMEVIMNKE